MATSLIKRFSVVAASALVAVSLVACDQGTLEANVKRDGSLEFVATGQATQGDVNAGIGVDAYQGLAIDPTGIEEGSMRIQIVNMDESELDEEETDAAGASNEDAADETSDSASDGETPDATGKTDGSESDDKTDDKSDSKKADSTTSASKGGEVLSGDMVAGALAANAARPISPQDGTTVFSRTFSAMDPIDDGDGIITIPDVPEGYYLVFVSSDHATGTMKVRAYDLTDDELAERKTQEAVDQVRDWLKELGGLYEEEEAA